MDIATFLSGVVGGSLVTGLIGVLAERSRRKHDRIVRLEERTEQRAIAQRERLESTYREAMVRLRAARAAFGRMADGLYAEEQQVMFPFSIKGSIDWAIDEADQLRTVQADIDLFGSNVVKAEFADAARASEGLRWSLGLPPPERDRDVIQEHFLTFAIHFDAVLELMRADLEA